jgi:hypothetical protein
VPLVLQPSLIFFLTEEVPVKKVIALLLFGILLSLPAMAQQLLQPARDFPDAKMAWFPYVAGCGGYEFDVTIQNHAERDIGFRLKWYNRAGVELLLDTHWPDGEVVRSVTSLYTTVRKGRGGLISFTCPSALSAQTGFMRVEVEKDASGNPGADFSLTFRYKPNGVTLTESTVTLVDAPTPGFTLYGRNAVEQGDQVETGIALTNLNDVPVTVDAFWLDPVTGEAMQKEVATLPARSADVRFISQFIPTLPSSFGDSITFKARDSSLILGTALKSSGRGKEIISTVPVRLLAP